MNIHSVSIREYRNIEQMDLELSPRANVLVGLNGQGKTNFLEAVYFALRGCSFRTQNNRDLIRRTTDVRTQLTRVSLSIRRDRVSDEVHAIVMDQKKVLKINGKPATASVLLTEFPLILFSPDSLSAIKDGPEARRDLMNEMILLGNPQNHRVINDYQKVLRGRNRLLKESLESGKANHELLGALGDTLLKYALELTEARRAVLTALHPYFREIAGMILKDDASEAELDYLISEEAVLTWTASDIEAKLRQRRFELYDAELRSGTTLWGPHRHDLSVTYGGNTARFFCSQGQQRALILALKISQIVHHFESYGKYPILLLDDVFSELDRERRRYLLDFLSDLKAQSILTSTDVQARLAATVIEVSNGRGALVRSKSVGDSAEGLLG